MSRVIEWVLATFGAATSVGIGMYFWQQQSSWLAPGESLWPLPAVVLLEMAVLGLVGLMSVAIDDERHLLFWGSVTWGVVGALFTLVVLGAFSVGPFLFPGVLAFCAAAVLADRRRGRGIGRHLGLAAVMAAANGVVLFFVLVATRR